MSPQKCEGAGFQHHAAKPATISLKEMKKTISLLILFSSIAMNIIAQSATTINCDRYIDLGGGNTRWQQGTLFTSGTFTQTTSLDATISFYGLTAGTLDAINNQPVILKSLWDQTESMIPGYNSTNFQVSTETYDIDNVPYYLVSPKGTTPPPATPQWPDARSVAMSTRAYCKANGSVIPGLVIHDTGSDTNQQTVLIRVSGPNLKSDPSIEYLKDPQLVVNRYSGGSWTVVGSNDNWSADATTAETLRTAFAATGATPFDAGSKDAAILLTLPCGIYTIQANSAVPGDSGEIVVEVYTVKE